jgi:hypothetical protein
LQQIQYLVAMHIYPRLTIVPATQFDVCRSEWIWPVGVRPSAIDVVSARAASRVRLKISPDLKPVLVGYCPLDSIESGLVWVALGLSTGLSRPSWTHQLSKQFCSSVCHRCHPPSPLDCGPSVPTHWTKYRAVQTQCQLRKSRTQLREKSNILDFQLRLSACLF